MEFKLRIVATVGLLIMVSIATSCTEEMDSGSTSATAPPPDQPPQSRTVVPSQSALGGAKRAAENTRDRVANYQKDIEKRMEDDE